MKGPDFIIIGAQKAATTYVSEQLSKQNSISMLPGEPQFWNRCGRGIKIYLDQFENLTQGAMWGEKTPDYLHMSRKRIRFLHRHFPDLKLIVILRDPSERAWSQARMEVSQMNTKEITQDSAKCFRRCGSERNIMRSRYTSNLKKWLSIYTRSKVLILFYEDLQTEPESFFLRIGEHLSCTVDISLIDQRKSWVSRTVEGEQVNMYKDFLGWFYHKEKEALQELGIVVPACWRDTGRYNFRLSLEFFLSNFATNLIYRLGNYFRGEIITEKWNLFTRIFHNFRFN